jgi:hypothetical protein
MIYKPWRTPIRLPPLYRIKPKRQNPPLKIKNALRIVVKVKSNFLICDYIMHIIILNRTSCVLICLMMTACLYVINYNQAFVIFRLDKDSVFTPFCWFGLVLFLLYAYRHRSVLGAAGYIILTPANQFMEE